MSNVEIGFFCKTGDPVIYKWKRTSFQDRFPYSRYKQAWLDEDPANIVIEQEIESASFNFSELCNDGGVIDIDLPVYIAKHKAQFIQSLKDYRWDLFNAQLYVGAQIINVDTDGRQELSFNTQSFSAMPVEDRPATVPFKELDDAGWIDVDPTSAIGWQIMISMSDSLESRTAQKAVEVLISALATKIDIDAFDVVSEFDAILKPVLAANLVKYAYPVKYHNEDLP